LNIETRDALRGAIAKARLWIDDLVEERIGSFSEIATWEGKAERHIRLLAPLAFVSPRIVSDIVDGVAPSNLTVTSLAKRLAYSWAEQEHCRKPRQLSENCFVHAKVAS
jgi:site-specific DNA recombinase